MTFDLNAFQLKVVCEGDVVDTKVETAINGNELDLSVTATKDRLKFIELKWDVQTNPDEWVLGDAWERSYGELEFKPAADNDRPMPWYFITTDKRTCDAFGVKTQPNAFINFRCTGGVITALVDCRNGGEGVHLNGRKLHVATFLFAHYDSGDVYANLKDFCARMCPNPILPTERIYGSNNWYYAYGESSYEEIVQDTKFLMEMTAGIENPPFEVIDDCWEMHSVGGPWKPNAKFRDMKALADEIKALGARPGIWLRFLNNYDPEIPDEWKILRDGKREFLDPTYPAVKQHICEILADVRGWGYELIKHDFTTWDMFGNWGFELTDTITKIDGWHFYDPTKTNAEIVLDLYRLIRKEAGDMYIIGCNTVPHLCAGLVHLNRIGDDTSGREWDRTRKMGINTLAFRLAQNETFYMCDADCVGIIGDEIPWEKNKQWLHLLSYSNTPMFVSCNNTINAEKQADITAAYRVFNQPHTLEPLDIYGNVTPAKWNIDGEIVEYDW